MLIRSLDCHFEGIGQFACELVTRLRPFLKGCCNHISYRQRNRWVENSRVWWDHINMAMCYGVIDFSNERCTPGERLVQHDAQRINICPSIHLSSHALFWRHVFGSTHTRSWMS